MKANKVRRGNWVCHSANHQCQIGEIAVKHFKPLIGDERWLDFSGAVGMPITVHWLCKYGFKSDANYEGYSLTTEDIEIYFTIDKKSRNLSKIVTIMQYYKEITIPYDIKYIHQLQNLYYAICGVELTWINGIKG